MERKLQIFISSTYEDLIEERQAAVQAVLDMGHIPAGMELFKAGKETLETIYKWIDESDIYILILGGRYGSIESESGKSYTHLEYEYALRRKKPLFAIVITELELDKRVRERGLRIIERKNIAKYDEFRDLVNSKLRYSFEDIKDVREHIKTMIPDFIKNYDFSGCGWLSAKSVIELEEEIVSLRHKLELLNKQQSETATSDESAGESIDNVETKGFVNSIYLSQEVLSDLRAIRYRALENLDDELEIPVFEELEFDADDFESEGSISGHCRLKPNIGNGKWDAFEFFVFYNRDKQDRKKRYASISFSVFRGEFIELGGKRSDLQKIIKEMDMFEEREGNGWVAEYDNFRTDINLEIFDTADIEFVGDQLAKLFNVFIPLVESCV